MVIMQGYVEDEEIIYEILWFLFTFVNGSYR